MNLPLCLLSHPILKKIQQQQQQQQQHNRNKSKTFSEQSKRMWGWNPQKPMKLDENDTILSHHPYILCNFAMSVFFSTQLPEIHPSSVIYYWILLPCFLIYTVLHTPNACCRNSVNSNWVKRGLKSKYGYIVVYTSLSPRTWFVAATVWIRLQWSYSSSYSWWSDVVDRVRLSIQLIKRVYNQSRYSY